MRVYLTRLSISSISAESGVTNPPHSASSGRGLHQAQIAKAACGALNATRGDSLFPSSESYKIIKETLFYVFHLLFQIFINTLSLFR